MRVEMHVEKTQIEIGQERNLLAWKDMQAGLKVSHQNRDFESCYTTTHSLPKYLKNSAYFKVSISE
jgi:hypothetical protein